MSTKSLKLPASRAGNGSNGVEGFENVELEKSKLNIQISAPKMRTAEFIIVGDAPLVVHKFSSKAKAQMLETMEAGSVAKKGKKREPFVVKDKFNEARYIAKEGWDGFNVSGVRNGLVRACSIVGFQMTKAKMGIFVLADGYDELERQIGLIRICAKNPKTGNYTDNAVPECTQMPARVETGAVYITVRPAYNEWAAKLRIRFDSEMFSMTDVANLLARMGEQIGLCEGRPFSKNSCGMGWGTFVIQGHEESGN